MSALQQSHVLHLSGSQTFLTKKKEKEIQINPPASSELVAEEFLSLREVEDKTQRQAEKRGAAQPRSRG